MLITGLKMSTPGDLDFKPEIKQMNSISSQLPSPLPPSQSFPKSLSLKKDPNHKSKPKNNKKNTDQHNPKLLLHSSQISQINQINQINQLSNIGNLAKNKKISMKLKEIKEFD
jgi:hypothetical protein